MAFLLFSYKRLCTVAFGIRKLKTKFRLKVSLTRELHENYFKLPSHANVLFFKLFLPSHANVLIFKLFLPSHANVLISKLFLLLD